MSLHAGRSDSETVEREAYHERDLSGDVDIKEMHLSMHCDKLALECQQSLSSQNSRTPLQLMV